MRTSDRARTLLSVLSIALLLSGCAEQHAAEDVRRVRLAGQPDSARALALSLLNQNANQMAVWLEFARAGFDAVRLRPNEQSRTHDMDILLQSALVCGAEYQKDKQNPPRPWHDTGELLSAEVARHLSTEISGMTTQMQSAIYLKPLLAPTGPDSLVPRDTQINAQQLLADYRSGARNYLFWGVVLRRLLETLPEVNPGTASLLAGQHEEALTAWMQALELDPAYRNDLQRQARQAIDQALGHASQDLHDLGYFLPQTITDNGVSP